MIIGEAPGENEDIQGLPFVGRSGQLLQNLLGSYGFTNNDYHICNIAKCRPPQNRRPTPEEIHACKPLLAEQFMRQPEYFLDQFPLKEVKEIGLLLQNSFITEKAR